MRIKVKSCSRCPFGREYHGHGDCSFECHFGPNEYGPLPEGVHHDCPLRSGPVQIKLHEYAEVSE